MSFETDIQEVNDFVPVFAGNRWREYNMNTARGRYHFLVGHNQKDEHYAIDFGSLTNLPRALKTFLVEINDIDSLEDLNWEISEKLRKLISECVVEFNNKWSDTIVVKSEYTHNRYPGNENYKRMGFLNIVWYIEADTYMIKEFKTFRGTEKKRIAKKSGRGTVLNDFLDKTNVTKLLYDKNILWEISDIVIEFNKFMEDVMAKFCEELKTEWIKKQLGV